VILDVGSNLDSHRDLANLIEARFGLGASAVGDRLAAFLGDRAEAECVRLTAHLAVAPLSDPEWRRLVEAMLVHETYFYRHMDQLEILKRELLRLQKSQSENPPLQIWCAGCATGEEAYTLAFVLREMHRRGRILATDLSVGAIEEARAGVYRRRPGLNSFRAMPIGGWRFFQPHPLEPECWTVNDEIRRNVDFSAHNLMAPPPNRLKADLISCRNTLIYLSNDGLRRAEATLVAAARPGTVLLLGPAERLRFSTVFVPLSADHPQILHWPRDEQA